MNEGIYIIDTPKGKIEYSIRGNGEPILFMHGSLQNCNDDMGYEKLLKAGFSIITPSRPGYGNTPLSSGKTAEESADLMNELLKHLKISSVNLITSSYGGITGLYLAAKYPGKVKKLVLLSSVTSAIEDKKRLASAKKFYGKSHILFWKLLNFMGKTSKKSLVKKTYQLFSTCDVNKIMQEISEEDINAVVKFYKKKPQNIGGSNDLDHTITADVFEKIVSPTLIIHSKEDKAVPFYHAETAKNKIKNTELFIAKTWGHFALIGKGSDEVLKKIIDFFLIDSFGE